MTAPITIPDELAGRLEKLAAEAGRIPQEMLEYVMCDGFEATEREIKLIKQRLADTRPGIPNDKAMAALDQSIDTHAKKNKAA
jgi:predicted transcriptional regulator